jgi:hypothetical protein
VHVAEIVALAVLPEREEVLASPMAELGTAGMGRGVASASGREPDQLLDLGVHHEPVDPWCRRRRVEAMRNGSLTSTDAGPTL